MGVEVLVLILIVFMFIGSLIATESGDLLSSVIAIGAVGFALSIIDLLLAAPDLAMTQVVVEVIALVLLIRLVITRREESTDTPRDALRVGVVLLAMGLLLVGVFLAVGGVDADIGLPRFGEPVMSGAREIDGVMPGVGLDYLENAAAETGATNVVMAVLLDYRAYDTLGEATVIFVSILGAYALLRKVGRRREVAKS